MRRAILVLEISGFGVAFHWTSRVAASLSGGHAEKVDGFHYLAFAAVAVPLWVALVALLVRCRGERLASLGLVPPASGFRRALVKGVFTGLAISFATMPLVDLLSRLGFRSDDLPFAMDDWGSYLAWLIAAPLSGGVGEELIYRGYLFARFEALRRERTRGVTALAVLATSVWFGVEHLYQGTLGAVTVGMMGLAFAALYLESQRNLVPVMIAHATVDVCATTLHFLT